MGTFTCLTSREQKCGKTKLKAIDYCHNRVYSTNLKIFTRCQEVLETLAFVLPSQHCNIITLIASQGDMPQKLSGGGEGDRFIPLYLLADKNKGDFGEIVTFRCREMLKGASTDIKDYY